MMREVCRRWTICGLFTLVVLMAGCDPCMNNPCDNGLACDGLENCSADGGQAVCADGTPVSCDFPTFCTEPDGACVDPCDGADCGDGDSCTTDTCETNEDGTTTCSNVVIDSCTDGDGDMVGDGTITDGDGLDGDETPVQVDVLQFDNFYYPTGLFRCGAAEDPQEADDFCTEGSGCDEAHWHSDTVAAIASMMEPNNVSDNTIGDPSPCFCGHGRVSEVTRTTIEIDPSELANFLDATSLDELPAAGACPP